MFGWLVHFWSWCVLVVVEAGFLCCRAKRARRISRTRSLHLSTLNIFNTSIINCINKLCPCTAHLENDTAHLFTSPITWLRDPSDIFEAQIPQHNSFQNPTRRIIDWSSTTHDTLLAMILFLSSMPGINVMAGYIMDWHIMPAWSQQIMVTTAGWVQLGARSRLRLV